MPPEHANAPRQDSYEIPHSCCDLFVSESELGLFFTKALSDMNNISAVLGARTCGSPPENRFHRSLFGTAPGESV